MNRRQALTALAAGTASLAIPAWIARAFAQSAPSSDAPCAAESHSAGPTPNTLGPSNVPQDFASALTRADRAGKPLLVLVVTRRGGNERAMAFGELINHGTPDALALLACCEIVCAPMSAVRDSMHDAGEGEPLMLLVETDGSTPRLHRMDGSLPVVAARTTARNEPSANEEDNIIDQRIEFLTALLEHAIAPNDAVVTRRAAQTRARLAASDLRALESLLSNGHPPATARDADRAAALVMLAAREHPAAHTRLVERLRDAAHARIRDRRIPGSRWAHSFGCGTTYEGENDNAMFGCGMGHIAARSQRFLDFFALNADNNPNDG